MKESESILSDKVIRAMGIGGGRVAFVAAFICGTKYWASGDSMTWTIVAFGSSILLAFTVYSVWKSTR